MSRLPNLMTLCLMFVALALFQPGCKKGKKGLINKARTEIIKQRFDKALALLLEAKKLAPKDQQIFMLLSTVYHNKKDNRNREKILLELLKIRPKDSEAKKDLGETYIDLGKEVGKKDRNKAIGYLMKAAKYPMEPRKKYILNTQLANYYNYQGRRLEKELKYEKAAQSFEKVAKYHPNPKARKAFRAKAEKLFRTVFVAMFKKKLTPESKYDARRRGFAAVAMIPSPYKPRSKLFRKFEAEAQRRAYETGKRKLYQILFSLMGKVVPKKKLPGMGLKPYARWRRFKGKLVLHYQVFLPVDKAMKFAFEIYRGRL